MKHMVLVGLIGLSMSSLLTARAANNEQTVGTNEIVEIALKSGKAYQNPFMDAELNIVVTQPDRTQLRVPGFWAGGSRWCFRYASPVPGIHTWRSECSDTGNAQLHGVVGKIEVVPYRGGNPLYQNGPIHIAKDHRHFEHADGTPFFWLGDTWWKGLCKRMTWEGFQELTADRKAKGFSVVQIVCGPYPDEGMFEARWENEGGKPYGTRDFSRVNPAYFEFADRRIKDLVKAGIVPAIVGGWGRGDCDAMQMAGVDGIKRHWHNLIARYGAYPAVWIIGGESGGPQWTEVARYVQKTDPYHRPATIHPAQSARTSVTDESVIDFDMLQTGHGDWNYAFGAIPKLKAAYAQTPPMPTLIGEYCYEGHMQTGFQDEQRYVFWASMLSGSAGLTYGAAGVWHAGVEGDPGLAHVYDRTTWKEGMNYPGSTQLGIGKRLLESYPWSRFEPHPEWADKDCFAAGIPGKVRFVYQPKRGVYNWDGTIVRGLEPNVPYHTFYFDPVNGKRIDQGTFVWAGPFSKPFEGHTQPKIFFDAFQQAGASGWKDYGSPSQRKNGHLVGGKGMVTILEEISDADLMASVDANSDAEAGIILRFHDVNNYLVALYSPSLKSIFLHDRTNGEWGTMLGRIPVPAIGPNIHLIAAACGDNAAMVLTDGTNSYHTPVVKVRNTAPGKPGLWLYQIGERQEFSKFELSHTPIIPPKQDFKGAATRISSDEFHAPPLPSPQDWVLVMERVK